MDAESQPSDSNVPGNLAFQSMVTLIRAIEAGLDSVETLFVISAFEALTVGLIILCLGAGISALFLLLRRDKPVV